MDKDPVPVPVVCQNSDKCKNDCYHNTIHDYEIECEESECDAKGIHVKCIEVKQ